MLHALLQPGDRLVVPHDAYGGSWRLFNALARKGHFELVTADLTDPRALSQALATQPKLVLVETPSNPMMNITDIAALAELAHARGVEFNIEGNPFAPPREGDLPRRLGGVLRVIYLLFSGRTPLFSGTVGLGNVAGVAVAITIGGPGATLWIILAGLLGMSLKAAEATLGAKYRRVNDDGTVSGGPMYYLRDGLKSLQLAFREASTIPDEPGQGPGEKFTGPVR